MPSLPYAPVSPSIPLLLAPSSRPSSPASSSSFALSSSLLAKRLAQLDSERRRTGLAHVAPASAGAARLLATAVKGEWGRRRPPWALQDKQGRQASEEDNDEARAWREIGVEGIPRDMDEWEEWEQRKSSWRAMRDRDVALRLSSEEQEGDMAETVPHSEEPVKEKEGRRGGSWRASSPARPAPLPAPARQPKLSSLFGSSKPSITAATAGKPPSSAAFSSSSSSSKKRPPTSPAHSPPPGPPAPRRTTSTSDANGHGARRKNGKEPSRREEPDEDDDEAETGETREREQRTNGRSLGEDEEILFEGGCTQMVLPDPTPQPHLAPSSHAHPNPNSTTRYSSPAPLLPYSSPGLNHAHPPHLGGLEGAETSTPYLTRPAKSGRGKARREESLSPSTRSSFEVDLPDTSSRSRSGSPPPAARAPPHTQLSTLATTLAAETLAYPKRGKMHRLSSIARTESQRSSVKGWDGLAEQGGGGDEEVLRVLEEDARD
ncbi:hypothetical protein JCM8097_005832 [Rhodosporidiobolus ruineniae]